MQNWQWNLVRKLDLPKIAQVFVQHVIGFRLWLQGLSSTSFLDMADHLLGTKLRSRQP